LLSVERVDSPASSKIGHFQAVGRVGLRPHRFPLSSLSSIMQSLSGQSFIGFARSQSTGPVQRCVNPATATELPTDFFQATSADVEQACVLAQAAVPVLAALGGKQKAAFLRGIASRIEAATQARPGLACSLNARANS
jgi:delta 1-pyrroline-5-carboxylate dehydrogenase